MVAYNLIVEGKVQGVWFRDFAKKIAETLELTGWIRNDPEETVTIFVQGEEEDVESLLAKIWQGPEAAKVKNINKEPADEDPGITMFEVRY